MNFVAGSQPVLGGSMGRSRLQIFDAQRDLVYYYRAPEMIVSCPFDEKIDTWALGVLFWFDILAGKLLAANGN